MFVFVFGGGGMWKRSYGSHEYMNLDQKLKDYHDYVLINKLFDHLNHKFSLVSPGYVCTNTKS